MLPVVSHSIARVGVKAWETEVHADEEVDHMRCPHIHGSEHQDLKQGHRIKERTWRLKQTCCCVLRTTDCPSLLLEVDWTH